MSTGGSGREVLKTEAVTGEAGNLLKILEKMESLVADYEKNLRSIHETAWIGDASDHVFTSFQKDYEKIKELQDTMRSNVKFLDQTTGIYLNFDELVGTTLEKIGKIM